MASSVARAPTHLSFGRSPATFKDELLSFLTSHLVPPNLVKQPPATTDSALIHDVDGRRRVLSAGSVGRRSAGEPWRCEGVATNIGSGVQANAGVTSVFLVNVAAPRMAP